MSNPRFSIVIPTRNRHNTLEYALLTCLNQNFDNYDIIICDNCSSPETRETVESFESEKIKYIRSDRPLAMSQNWELAVSHADGEYVIVIGDDDGLLLNALSKIDKLLKELGVKALCWDPIFYNWPDCPKKIDGGPNRILIPLVRENQIVQSSKVISKIANCRMSTFNLPQLYNSAIHRDLIALLKKRTGRIFSCRCPDSYSGFAFAYLTQSYAHTGIPMSISAHSSSSTCNASLYSKDNPISQEFKLLCKDDDMFKCHPKVPDIPVIPSVIVDSFQHAKDALFQDDRNFSINRKKMIYKYAKALRRRYEIGLDDEQEWRMHLIKIRDSLADDVDLQKWFDSKSDVALVNDFCIGWMDLLIRFDRKFLTCFSKKLSSFDGFERGFNGSDLVLDGSEFALKNVFDVAEFCERFYTTNINGLDWHSHGVKNELLMLIKKMRVTVGRILSSL